jgi:hypothetical protein
MILDTVDMMELRKRLMMGYKRALTGIKEKPELIWGCSW